MVLEPRYAWMALHNLRILRLLDQAVALMALVLWPRIDNAVRARRIAWYGIPVCLLIGAEWPFRHFAWPDQIPLSMVALKLPLALVMTAGWFGLAAWISTISRAASVVALCVYLLMCTESLTYILRQGGGVSMVTLGVSVLFALALQNSVRGAAAYRRLAQSA